MFREFSFFNKVGILKNMFVSNVYPLRFIKITMQNFYIPIRHVVIIFIIGFISLDP